MTIKKKRKSLTSVTLESPLVTEEGLIQAGEQPTEDVETSFKLAPKKPETIEEFVTLEQPTEASVTLEKPERPSEEVVEESQVILKKKKKSVSEVKPDEITIKRKKSVPKVEGEEAQEVGSFLNPTLTLDEIDSY